MLLWGEEAYRPFGSATGLFFGLLGIAYFLWTARPHSEVFDFPLAAASVVWLFFGWLAWVVRL